MINLWKGDWFMIFTSTTIVRKSKLKRLQIIGKVLLKRKATKLQGI